VAVAALGGRTVSGDEMPVLDPWPSEERHECAGRACVCCPAIPAFVCRCCMALVLEPVRMRCVNTHEAIPVQPAVGDPASAGALDWMTHRGPFQSRTFCDSVIL